MESEPMAIAWVYDMDACRGPTGVTRHALAQLDHLIKRPEVNLRVVSGRIADPDGLARWEMLDELPEAPRRIELPFSTRNTLRFWRLFAWPPIDYWTGRLDWIYCPAEYYVPTRRLRRAVTSHDILQDIRFGSPSRRELLGHALGSADRVLSVSEFNTTQLLQYFPECTGKVATVPNAADDLFFETTTAPERLAARPEIGLKQGQPYLLSVANFQPRKNLSRLVRVASRLTEVASGDLALVLIGEGDEHQTELIREAIQASGSKATILMPGYRQGPKLRALYAEATALVFPSTCESFGIPAVEAMAQGCPLALANSTALPETAGDAAWYFDPEVDDSIYSTLRSLLDSPTERDRLTAIGRTVAVQYRWKTANDALLRALSVPPIAS